MRDPDRETPNAHLVERVDVSDGIARFVIRPEGGVPRFEAGQYFAIGTRIDGRFVQRPYSTASAPGEPDTLEFLVRLVPDGAFTPGLWQLPVGAPVRLGPPRGRFTLLPGDERQHLFVSTGTGLAPFVSMLHALGRRQDPPPTVVVHGAARALDLAYRDELERWPLGSAWVRYLPAVSRPADPTNATWTGLTGRVDAVLGAALPRLIRTAGAHALVAYVCGNPAMVSAVRDVLVGHGVEPSAVRTEEYWVQASGGRDAGSVEAATPSPESIAVGADGASERRVRAA